MDLNYFRSYFKLQNPSKSSANLTSQAKPSQFCIGKISHFLGVETTLTDDLSYAIAKAQKKLQKHFKTEKSNIIFPSALAISFYTRKIRYRIFAQLDRIISMTPNKTQ